MSHLRYHMSQSRVNQESLSRAQPWCLLTTRCYFTSHKMHIAYILYQHRTLSAYSYFWSFQKPSSHSANFILHTHYPLPSLNFTSGTIASRPPQEPTSPRPHLRLRTRLAEASPQAPPRTIGCSRAQRLSPQEAIIER